MKQIFVTGKSVQDEGKMKKMTDIPRNKFSAVKT
jgi:hypothetical protein